MWSYPSRPVIGNTTDINFMWNMLKARLPPYIVAGIETKLLEE
jgi:hypothetical protein